jgi:HD-GYP domain-containing protein (c-di-GMP phosphodiesterase class II)
MTDDAKLPHAPTPPTPPTTPAQPATPTTPAQPSPPTPRPLPIGEDLLVHPEEAARGGALHYSAAQARRAKDVLARLHALRRGVRFYPLEHPAVREGVEALGDAIRAYHDEGVELQFAFFQGEILLGDQLLAEESVTYDQFVRDMQSIGVGSLIFKPGVDSGELARAATVLALDEAEADLAGGVLRVAEVANLPHVQIGLVLAAEPEFQGTPDEMAFNSFSQAVELIEDMDETLRRDQSVNPQKVRGTVRSLVDGVLSNRKSMMQLAGLKNYDEYTFYHSVNVAILSLALGSIITKDEQFLTTLGTGALMHDIGKLTVGHEIINKPGQLTADEWEAMQLHPVYGAEMLALMPGIDRAAIVPVLEHHMRYDGAGYPQRNPARPQHLISRIVAVADAYDAMTSRRSYSAARVQDRAMSLLVEGAGTSLDPVLVRLFVNMLGMYPPRTVVRLSTQEVAIVVSPTDGEPLRPTVRIITSPDGELVEPHDVLLAEHNDLTVEETLDPRLLNIQVEDYV